LDSASRSLPVQRDSLTVASIVLVYTSRRRLRLGFKLLAIYCCPLS
jgi:hypothetical protein